MLFMLVVARCPEELVVDNVFRYPGNFFAFKGNLKRDRKLFGTNIIVGKPLVLFLQMLCQITSDYIAIYRRLLSA